MDIWHDDEGVWYQRGPQTIGPFATEEEAIADVAKPRCRAGHEKYVVNCEHCEVLQMQLSGELKPTPISEFA